MPKYYGIGHESNDNYIAMISGQAPNPLNQSDCQQFGTSPRRHRRIRSGDRSGLRVPLQRQDDRRPARRRRPDLARLRPEHGRRPDPRADRVRAPADRPAGPHPERDRHRPVRDPPQPVRLLPLDHRQHHAVRQPRGQPELLPQDLSSAASTPNYVFITPDLCGDGHDATCADPKRPGGFAGIDQFLEQWVPAITGSPAFRDDNGLLAIIFDEASTSDSSSCCGEIPGPTARSRASGGQAAATPARC